MTSQELDKVVMPQSGPVKIPHLSEYLPGQFIPNPLAHTSHANRFRDNNEYVLANIARNAKTERNQTGAISPKIGENVGYVRAGAREKIFFEPSTVRAAIVTCGGLCPGMNSVIREICCSLYRLYGASEVWGVRYGYEGFYSTANPPVRLTPDVTKNCHSLGGTILGSSRGGFDLQKIVGGIIRHGFNQVFIIGGDGTHRGAQAIFQEVRKRKLKVAVVGVPKTIDNDLSLIDRSFGFDTAVVEAEKALRAAAVEAECAVNGLCIVQLMGRNAGFVAAHAALASRQVDICLVPEVRFDKDALLAYIKQLLLKQESCVICQAEAAGLEYCQSTGEKDKSGNPRLPDVSQWLKSEITASLKAEGSFREINCRIINPSYMIRSVPPNIEDRQYCSLLAIHAVHAAMAGHTGVTIGLINNHYVYLPLMAMTSTQMDPNGRIWHRVIELTRQPDFTKPLPATTAKSSL